MSEHNEKVNEIKKLFTKLKLPNLPSHIVYCKAYRPDACTRIDHGFVVIEYINSVDRFNWDIGGLTLLLLHKDIIDYAVAVLSEKVYKEYKDLLIKIKKHRNPILEKLVILREDELENWLREKKEQSKLWKPEELIVK